MSLIANIDNEHHDSISVRPCHEREDSLTAPHRGILPRLRTRTLAADTDRPYAHKRVAERVQPQHAPSRICVLLDHDDGAGLRQAPRQVDPNDVRKIRRSARYPTVLSMGASADGDAAVRS
jgi:hypothetical protein